MIQDNTKLKIVLYFHIWCDGTFICLYSMHIVDAIYANLLALVP